jgi:SAM-dependent methyltransferase
MRSHEQYVKQTAAHYTKRWGADLDFQNFVKSNPEGAKAMPSRQLFWEDLFARIRSDASSRRVKVYDAACGFGDIMNKLTASPNPEGLVYFGMDLHGSLEDIERPQNAALIQGDITKPAGSSGLFDYILCRAAIHRTPDPAATYRIFANQLAPGGAIAITAYAKKAPMREAVDDALRHRIVPMESDAAFAVANQLTRLGRDLQACGDRIAITADLPFLGIKAGSYSVQSFIYQHFIKCWHNPAFSERHYDLVNFDWYHPPYAYRFELDELERWPAESGLILTRTACTEAQHYFEAAKPA